MKTKKTKYVDLQMRFNQGLMKYEPDLPLEQEKEISNAYDKGWWKALLKMAGIAAAWAFLVWLLYSSTR